ncbi:thiolase family protein, partial [Candidatus Woesearchaeota archaeon]|nr:thiolase family protein [Candidatus Woesearchaeota archaeon]
MYIKGVGMTKFGAQTYTSQELVYEATLEALNDADFNIGDIDAVVVSAIDTESNGERQRLFSNVLSSILRKKVPILTVTAVCGGGGAALWTANKLDYNNVLVAGVERLLTNNSMRILNPKARFYKKKVSLEEIKKSPVVASPLRLFDCSLSVNGAAVAILTRDKTDVEISGSSLFVDRLSAFESNDMTSWDATKLAAEEAYKQAGISPSDIDIAEMHDAFTSVELISYEDLGFCKKGDGKEMIRKGITNIDGKMPVNTSGGLKAKGHPISATGVSQIYEIVKQMRNECGERQVSDVKYALAQNIGGAGSTVTVHVLRKV